MSWWYPYPGFVKSRGLSKGVDLSSDEKCRSNVLLFCLIRKTILPENGHESSWSFELFDKIKKRETWPLSADPYPSR